MGHFHRREPWVLGQCLRDGGTCIRDQESSNSRFFVDAEVGLARKNPALYDQGQACGKGHDLVDDRPRFAVQLPSQSMILLSGYSTIPVAPAAFNCGTIVRTTFSSMIVFTSAHSGLDSAEIVGVCRAGRIFSTA